MSINSLEALAGAAEQPSNPLKGLAGAELVSAAETLTAEYTAAFALAGSAPAQPGVVGLRNPGHLDFMSATLQCLAACEPLCAVLRSPATLAQLTVHSRFGSGGRLVLALAALQRAMLSGPARSPLVITPISQLVLAIATQFKGWEANRDPRSFLGVVLSLLVGDLSVYPKPGYEDAVDGKQAEAVVADEAWRRHLSRDDCLVNDVFGGLIMSHLRCASCGSDWVRCEPCLERLLFLPEGTRGTATTLQELLVHSEEEVHLKGVDEVYCRPCGQHRESLLTSKLWRLPPLLVFTLNRFQDEQTKSVDKDARPVAFPLQGLDMRQVLAGPPELAVPQAVYAEGREAEGPLLPIYDLVAVCCHTGVGGGMFTAAVQNSVTGKWHHCDGELSAAHCRALASWSAGHWLTPALTTSAPHTPLLATPAADSHTYPLQPAQVAALREQAYMLFYRVRGTEGKAVAEYNLAARQAEGEGEE